MSLARFAAMAVPRFAPDGARYSVLFLPRADLLGDPFEGSIPRPEASLRASDPRFKSFPPKYYDSVRRWTFTSCWHRNHGESAALWRLYAESEGSVAVRTSYARIRSALAHVDDTVAISSVAYIDYEKELFRLGDPLAVSQPFLHKRVSFEHEHEVRIVSTDSPPANTRPGTILPNDFLQDQPMIGKEFYVNLATLVESVHVAPSAPGWIMPTIQHMLVSWGWDSIPVKQSNSSAPLF